MIIFKVTNTSCNTVISYKTKTTTIFHANYRLLYFISCRHATNLFHAIKVNLATHIEQFFKLINKTYEKG